MIHDGDDIGGDGDDGSGSGDGNIVEEADVVEVVFSRRRRLVVV